MLYPIVRPLSKDEFVKRRIVLVALRDPKAEGQAVKGSGGRRIV